MVKIKLPLPRSEELLAALQTELGPNRRALLIAVDGPDGVGKSSLASWLAWQLGMPAVHLDLFLTKGSKPLCWRKEELSRIISARLDRERPVIVEGILVLDALREVGRHIDYLIYIRGNGSDALSGRIGDYNSRHSPEANAQFVLDGFDEITSHQ